MPYTLPSSRTSTLNSLRTVLSPVALATTLALLAACGSDGTGPQASRTTTASAGASDTTPAQIDMTCDNAPYPSQEWAACEQANFARVSDAIREQNSSPAFQQRYQTQSTANIQAWLARSQEDPSWLSPQSGNTSFTPLCATWAEPCAGDPFAYPDVDGKDGKPFYTQEAEVTPVVFYDRECARISGRVWAPKGSKAGDGLPNVVIENGSVQAPETLYWWAAQLLVRSGYVVMTFDPRGQGRSDQQTPMGTQGSNANPTVFWTGLVDAIDFFRSDTNRPYPHNVSCKDTYPTKTTAFNPFANRTDKDRMGIAGHSLGATGVSVVQSYGAKGAEAWPGKLDSTNPVKVVVAWDSITTPSEASTTPGPRGATPAVVPRVPILGINGEYGLTPRPFVQPPDPKSLTSAFRGWVKAGQPVVELTIAGSTHYEFSLLPNFPASSWCPDADSGFCSGGWGNAFSRHYTLAWFDRWLKKSGEKGFETADARLLDDNGPEGRAKMSFRFESARNFPMRDGTQKVCENIRKGC